MGGLSEESGLGGHNQLHRALMCTCWGQWVDWKMEMFEINFRGAWKGCHQAVGTLSCEFWGVAEGVNGGSRGSQEDQEDRILGRSLTVVSVADGTCSTHLPGLG